MPLLNIFLILFGLQSNNTNLGGVVRTPINDFLSRYLVTKTVYIDGNIEKIRACIGMQFDVWGILGVKVKKRIHCIDKMFCFKLIALGATHYRDEFIYTATGQKLLEISRDKP